MKEVVLEPGDLLYLPTGAWHQTQANGYSLSITMGHEPVQAHKFISDLITGAVWADEASRRHLPPMHQTAPCEGASEATVRAALEDALSTLRTAVDRLTPDLLLQAWKMQIRIEQKKRRRQQATGKAGSRQSSHPLLAALGAQRSENGVRP